jgi:hypothetical protein
MPPVATVLVGIVAVVGLAWGGTALYGALNTKSTANYAEEVAKPLEAALVKAGGVKKCSRGSDGLGSDNNRPWLYSIYELPGNSVAAAALARDVARDVGYSLKEAAPPANPEGKTFYSDNTSKKSQFSRLEDGNITLNLEVYSRHSYTGESDQFCTVTERDSTPSNKTTVRFTINLPAFKR